MTVSVIIPTYNEKRVLEDCIESLGLQSLDKFEIIVVDDGSDDGTTDILKNLKKSIPSFRFLQQKHEGPGAARNLGAKNARGEILVFVDADMTFDKDFLKMLVKPIDEGKAMGTFSKDEFVSNWDNKISRSWNINEGWQERRRHKENFPDFQPVFRAISKSEFDKVDGFTPGGYNDDWSLSKKLGYLAVNAPGAIFYHKNPSTLTEVFKHAQWVGKRSYKFGFIGYLVALVRTSLPFSILIGFYKSFLKGEPTFVLFKVVYDFGIFIGILKYIVSHSGAK